MQHLSFPASLSKGDFISRILNSSTVPLKADLSDKNCGSPRPFASFEVRMQALRSDLNRTSPIKMVEAPSCLLVLRSVFRR